MYDDVSVSQCFSGLSRSDSTPAVTAVTTRAADSGGRSCNEGVIDEKSLRERKKQKSYISERQVCTTEGKQELDGADHALGQFSGDSVSLHMSKHLAPCQ